MENLREMLQNKSTTKEQVLESNMEEREYRKKNPDYKLLGNTPIEAIKRAFDRGAKIANIQSYDLKDFQDKRVKDVVFDCEECGAVISRIAFIDCHMEDFDLILCDECQRKLWDELVKYAMEKTGMTEDELRDNGKLNDDDIVKELTNEKN